MRVATQYASAPCRLTISSYLFAGWHLFRHVDYLRHQQQVDLWPFDLESGVRVTCNAGYLCANFSLPRLLCSRVRPDVSDRQTSDVRQTDVRQKHRLMPPPYKGTSSWVRQQSENTRATGFCAPNTWPFESKINRLQQTLEDCYTVPIVSSHSYHRGFRFIVLTTYTPTYIRTYKAIAISAPTT